MLSSLIGGGGNRKVVLVVGLAVAIAGVWIVGRWAAAPMYVTLYRDLDFAKVAPIQESLQKAGIPNKLGQGGSSVLVPVADVARARVALAKDGQVVSGRPGLELFDKPTWGMTDFSQRVTYQRALEGELARTIGGIRGVERAQVHIVIPNPSPLRSLDRPASASVVLALKAGTSLTPEAIHGIAYVVSNSVDRLASDNVAIMDDAGHVLSVPAGEPNGSSGSTRQLEMQRAMEQTLAEKVEGLLTPLVGEGHSRTEVTVELSFDQIDRTIETMGGAADYAGGYPDTTYDSGNGAVGANSHELQRSISSTGKLVRLSAAVLIDQAALGDTATTRLQQIEGIVRGAIGVDSTRGDRLSLAAVAFEVPEEPGEETPVEGPKTDILGVAERFIRPVVGLVAVVVLALLGLRLVRMPAGMALNAAPGSAAAAAQPAPGAGETGASPEGGGAASNNPEVLLRVVRGWLRES
jgi:flagellar M-ring protein FliF